MFALKHAAGEVPKIVTSAFGHIGEEEKTYVPESEWPKVILEARVTLAIYAMVIAACFLFHSILPLLYIGQKALGRDFMLRRNAT